MLVDTILGAVSGGRSESMRVGGARFERAAPRRRTYTGEAAFFLPNPEGRSWHEGELLAVVADQLNPAHWDETSATFGASRVCCVARGEPESGVWEGALRESVVLPAPGSGGRVQRLLPRLELRTVLHVRMSRSRFQARVEYRLGQDCRARRAQDHCAPAEFGNGILDIDEGELTATELAGGVRVHARKTIRFASADPAGWLPSAAVEWAIGRWMEVELRKIERATGSSLAAMLEAVGAAALAV